MRLHHTTTGDGPAAVVFLHGLFGQGKNFTSIAQGIGDVARSWLVDLPDHGRSPWTTDFSLDDHSDLVADWLRDTHDAPVSLVGHSLGGKIAMRLALRHPELVERLMVVDISPARNDAEGSFGHLVAAMRSLDLDAVGSRTEADRALADQIPNPVVRGFLLQNLRRSQGRWAWSCNLELLGDGLDVVGGWPGIDGTFDKTVYWVAGADSDYVTDEHDAPMRELFPRTVAMRLRGAGHWVHSEQPEAFTATVRHFLTA